MVMIKYLFICSLLFFLALAPAWGSDTPDKNQVKAAFIYNFTKFITWPEESFSSSDKALVIGIVGADNLSGALQSLKGRKVQNHSIKIIHFKSVSEINDCHLLYIGSEKKDTISKALASVASKAVVTVNDSENFAEHGGIIQLISVRGRLRFIINQHIATNNNILFNSQLLKLAIKTIGQRQ